MNPTHAAHIVTGEAEALGTPELIIMTRDEGFGADVVERHSLDETATVEEAIAVIGSWTGYRPVGIPTIVGTGYVIVDVTKA